MKEIKNYNYTSKISLKNNMKPVIHITGDTHGTLINMKKERFEVIKNNLIISEINVKKGDRRFIISMRNDGNYGEYRMTQLSSLTERDLITIRDSIDIILSIK